MNSALRDDGDRFHSKQDEKFSMASQLLLSRLGQQDDERDAADGRAHHEHEEIDRVDVQRIQPPAAAGEGIHSGRHCKLEPSEPPPPRTATAGEYRQGP